MSTMSVDGNVPLTVKTSNVVKLFDSGCNILDLLPMKVAPNVLNLGLSLPADGQGSQFC